jgi:hypothetical protein
MTVYANLESKEGNVSGEVTLTFNLAAKQLIITNDSGSNDLKYKFKANETFATLKPTETITLKYVSLRQIILSGTNNNYRVWGIG